MTDDGAAPACALVIGDKSTSSWSLRPWLALRRFGVPFEEINVALDRPGTRAQILVHSPAGRVPVLKAGDLVIWDSMAILEYVAEAHPEIAFWPRDAGARAIARAVSAEMHAGFYSLRSEMPMDFLTVSPVSEMSDRVRGNIDRIVEIWRRCRSARRATGPFLFGDFSIADAMYAPVASRFRSYGVDPGDHGDDGTAAAYARAILALPELACWADGARREVVARRADGGP